MHNTTHPIRTLHLSFNHEIYARQISNWRGAFIEMAGLDNDLFHNHNGQQFYHYRYPLIQYRMHKGKACIFAINEGVDAIQKALSENEWEIRWGDEIKSLSVEDMRMNEHYLRMLSKPKQYKLFKWIALNEENYTKWLKAKNMIERVQLLQSTLYGHITQFCKAMQFEFSEPLEVNIQNIQMMEQVKCHKVNLLAFNIAYDCNVLLPNGIALGKSVSHGFGWQMPRRVPKKGDSRRRNVNFMPEPDIS
jgi:hypothetical protein